MAVARDGRTEPDHWLWCAERGETSDNHHAGSERGDVWPKRMCARGQELIG